MCAADSTGLVALTATTNLQPLANINLVRVVQVVGLGKTGVGGVELSSNSRKGISALDGVSCSRVGTSCSRALRSSRCHLASLYPELQPLTDVDAVRVAQMVKLGEASVSSVELVGNAGQGVTTLDGVGTGTSRLLLIAVGILDFVAIALCLCPELQLLTDIDQVWIAQVIDLGQTGIGSAELVGDA